MCQATQAGGQRGQGAPEAGTQRIPALPTWEGEDRCGPQSQVPARPCQPGEESREGRPRPGVPPHPDRGRRLQELEGGRTEAAGSSQLTAITHDPQEKHAHWVCWETPLGSCRVQEPELSQRHIREGGLGRAVQETVMGLGLGLPFEDQEAEAGARDGAGTGPGPDGAHL